MFFPIKNGEDLENLEELASSKNQVDYLRLRNKLGNQNFHENVEKVFEPLTDTIKESPRDITKTMTETSIKNDKSLENLNDKQLEIMNDRGILATYLMSLLTKVKNPENSSQFKLTKVAYTNRVNDLLIHNTITVDLYNSLLKFRDLGKKFQLQADLLKMICNRNYKVDLANLSDKKLGFDFTKEVYFDENLQVENALRKITYKIN